MNPILPDTAPDLRSDKVDLMVGMYGEVARRIGFSDTAFRVFILMASHRIKSDRYFTIDYTPEFTPSLALSGSTTTT